jgi:hypothetical protein
LHSQKVHTASHTNLPTGIQSVITIRMYTKDATATFTKAICLTRSTNSGNDMTVRADELCF